jgi:PIN domain nuclease of toxin-antitoxin system
VKLLLDTCTVLWLARGDRALGPKLREILGQSGVEAWVSVVSAWEIAIKHGLGRLPLPATLAEFLPRLRDRYALSSLPVNEESALHVAKLPRLHADPFDRMLVSQAIVHGLTIVTPDPKITQYPARTIWSSGAQRRQRIDP